VGGGWGWWERVPEERWKLKKSIEKQEVERHRRGGAR
jgi:hypothetical protein